MCFIFHINTHTDGYLSLNGSVIPNHSYVKNTDIGSTAATALKCHTLTTTRYNYYYYYWFYYAWFAPDGTGIGYTDGFYGEYYFYNNIMVAILGRRTDTSSEDTSPEGIYHCSIDACTTNTLSVGLYNTGGGIIK